MTLVIRVVTFYLLTFLFTMVFGGLQQETGWATGIVTLPQLAPGLAALVMLLLFRKDALRLSTGVSSRVGRRSLVGFLAPVAVAALLFLILRPDVVAPETALWLFIPGMAIGAFGEELGWRAYLHKRLDRDMRPLVSSVLVGTIWALWHVQSYSNGAAYMGFLVLLMIAYSLVIYRLVADLDFNVWPAAAFHLGINVGNLVFLAIINDLRFIAANAIVWTIVAGALWWRQRADILTPHTASAGAAVPDSVQTGLQSLPGAGLAGPDE